MIERVSFRNFKALRHVDVPLERLTVLVGPNSSGKTSVLEGIHYVCQAEEWKNNKDAYFADDRHLSRLYSRGGEGEMEISLETTGGTVRMVFVPPEGPAPGLADPDGDPTQHSWGIRPEVSTGKPGHSWGAIRWGGPPLSDIRSRLLRLQASQLSAPSIQQTTPPRIGDRGEGLPSVLAYMAGKYPDVFQQLQDHLRTVIHSVQRVRTDRLPDRRPKDGEPPPYMRDALIFDSQGAPSLPASLVSEGAILVLGLLAVILGPSNPNVILLDDIDQGLHPRAQHELIGLIRKLLVQRPDLQIVATTHSPFLLDKLEPNEVRLTSLLDDGSVACARLVDHPDFERWKEEMTPGEFWSLVGEKWVGREPARTSNDAHVRDGV